MFRDTGVTTLPAVEALHVSVHDLSTDKQRMSHVVRKHLRLESDAYEAAIRSSGVHCARPIMPIENTGRLASMAHSLTLWVANS